MVLGGRARARIRLEASTDSEWVARCLEGLGHEVIVADPNFAPRYATGTRKVKTDGRQARALADACLLGAYHPAHRLSDAQRQVLLVNELRRQERELTALRGELAELRARIQALGAVRRAARAGE